MSLNSHKSPKIGQAELQLQFTMGNLMILLNCLHLHYYRCDDSRKYVQYIWLFSVKKVYFSYDFVQFLNSFFQYFENRLECGSKTPLTVRIDSILHEQSLLIATNLELPNRIGRT